MTQPEYKSRQELYEDARSEAKQMTTEEIKSELRRSSLYHTWLVDAYQAELRDRGDA